MVIVRLLLGLLTMLLVSVIVFGATELLPSDIASEVLGQSATPEAIAAMRAEFGLDRPLSVRYLDWLWGLLNGDL